VLTPVPGVAFAPDQFLLFEVADSQGDRRRADLEPLDQFRGGAAAVSVA